MLEKEYSIRDMMETFESKMKKMIFRSQNFSMIELFMEQDFLKQEIYEMQKELNAFTVYMPQYTLKSFENPEISAKLITDVLAAKLSDNLVPIDNSFCLENFEYATKELGNDIEKIY
jgi:hypothetical protein